MKEEALSLARAALKEAENRLSADFRYLVYPLGILQPTIGDGEDIATDGKTFTLGARAFLERVAEDGIVGAERTLLHVLLHVLFLHPFRIRRPAKIYDAACDVAVSFVLDGEDCVRTAGYKYRKEVYDAIKRRYGAVGESQAFAYLISAGEEERRKISLLFKVCDHSSWYGRNLPDKDEKSGDSANIATPDDNDYDGRDEAGEASWIEILRGALTDEGKSDEVQKSLVKVLSGKRDYRRFFDKFLSSSERVKPSEDEFDYIFYCYGLTLYKNVPLIESLEYSDVKDFEQVVFAIDTSASTDGEPIKKLLTELATVVAAASARGGKLKVRIIQCDMAIREDVTFFERDKFDEYMSEFCVKGGSGTDFAPVFDLLEEEKANGAKIRRLIYFTDGLGRFPAEIPPFKTCFAIYGDDENKITVPSYAYRLDIAK